MEEKIEPTTKAEKYVLEDKDYLLIQAIRNLTEMINKLAVSMN